MGIYAAMAVAASIGLVWQMKITTLLSRRDGAPVGACGTPSHRAGHRRGGVGANWDGALVGVGTRV